MVVTIVGIAVITLMVLMLVGVIVEAWREAKERRAFFERMPSHHEYMEQWRREFWERRGHD